MGSNAAKHFWLLLAVSYAHGTARADSDVNLVLFSQEIHIWLNSKEWLSEFGIPENIKFKDWGGVKTLRVFYKKNFEVEFNFALPTWTNTDPVDQGTSCVIKDGVQILFDPQGKLEHLVQVVMSTESKQ